MIDIICEEDKASNKVKLPKNVRQVGDVTSGFKIYIEDYAYTFITNVAYDGRGENKSSPYGVLIGEKRSDGQAEYLFIRGVLGINIQPEEDENEEKKPVQFTKQIWQQLHSEKDKYFKGQEIVGWFVTTNQEDDLGQDIIKIHRDNFSGAKVLLVVNLAQKEERFYKTEKGRLVKQNGFLCFYERNEEMQNYMLSTRPSRSVDHGMSDVVTQNFRTVLQERKEEIHKKQSVSLLYGVCAVMAVFVTIIGINVMNSYEKMQNINATMDRMAREIANMNVEAENFPIQEKDETPVKKIDGNVYPTEAQTNSAVEQASSEQVTEKQTQTQTQSQPSTQEPTASIEPVNARVPKKYVVKRGDTLMNICKAEYGDALKFHDLMELNNIADPNKIYEGQELIIP